MAKGRKRVPEGPKREDFANLRQAERDRARERKKYPRGIDPRFKIYRAYGG